MQPLSSIPDFHAAVSWENMTFSVPQREILKGLTGTARPGRTLACLGASGAGKTTWLKHIADRLSKEGDRTITGKILINDTEFVSKHRSLISFVPQDDILNGLASPEETLNFNARMRRGYLPEAEIEELVDSAIKELGLDHVRSQVIGVPGLTSGLSGGERKRVNIGAEYVSRPKVLLLDEPTTGLDTVTSERICGILQRLARKGHTVIYTIHQPTFDCLDHFDDLMLLAKGKVVYHGPYSEAVAYFSKHGFQCPVDSTPTDYFMWHLEDDKSAAKMVAAWEQHLESLPKDNLPPCLAVPYKGSGKTKEETEKFLDDNYSGSDTPYYVQLSELFKRALRNAFRNTMNIIATVMQAVLFGIFVGVLFNNLTNDPQGVADRFGVLFTMAVNTGFAGASAVINTFPAIKAVFLREQQAGAYSVGAFFFATFLADLPLQLLAMTIQVIIVYWSSGLAPYAENFFIFLAIMYMAQQVSVSIGLALSAGVSNPMLAAAIIPTVMTPMMLSGSYLTSVDRLRPGFVWLERISFIRMPFVLMAKNEFENVDSIVCDVAKYGARFCAVQPQNGTAVLQGADLNNDLDAKWISWLTLAAILVFTRLLGWWALFRSAGQKE